MCPVEHALGDARRRDDIRDRVREEGRRRRPLVQARRDASRVPAEQRQHDERDHSEDQVGLAEVRAVEARRSRDLADPERQRDAHEDADDEHVDERHEPALRAEPRQRPLAIHRSDHRHHDRREENEEAPEDERVHHTRQQALQQLLLAEHDRRLVLEALRNVVEALGRLPRAHEAREKARATCEQRAGDGERRCEGERAGQRRYVGRAFLSSAEIAGTISCRSPITA